MRNNETDTGDSERVIDFLVFFCLKIASVFIYVTVRLCIFVNFFRELVLNSCDGLGQFVVLHWTRLALGW